MSLVRCGGRSSPAYDCSDLGRSRRVGVGCVGVDDGEGQRRCKLDGRREAGGGIETRLDTRLFGRRGRDAAESKVRAELA